MAKYSYLFDLGNSVEGSIGLCARIEADTPEEALGRLQDELPESLKVPIDAKGGEYVEVYLNALNVTVRDIDEVDELEDEEVMGCPDCGHEFPAVDGPPCPECLGEGPSDE